VDWSATFGNPGASGGNVAAMVQNTSYIYIAGGFTSVGGVTTNQIARLNRSTGTWTALAAASPVPSRPWR